MAILRTFWASFFRAWGDDEVPWNGELTLADDEVQGKQHALVVADRYEEPVVHATITDELGG